GIHPGIVALRQTYLDADPPCLEYDFVAGRDLGATMRSLGHADDPGKVEAVTLLVRQLAETVGFMHRLTPPVVHRDLKPANVLVQRVFTAEDAEGRREKTGEGQDNSSLLSVFPLRPSASSAVNLFVTD